MRSSQASGGAWVSLHHPECASLIRAKEVVAAFEDKDEAQQIIVNLFLHNPSAHPGVQLLLGRLPPFGPAGRGLARRIHNQVVQSIENRTAMAMAATQPGIQHTCVGISIEISASQASRYLSTTVSAASDRVEALMSRARSLQSCACFDGIRFPSWERRDLAGVSTRASEWCESIQTIETPMTACFSCTRPIYRARYCDIVGTHRLLGRVAPQPAPELLELR
jgi:hypothetical protein